MNKPSLLWDNRLWILRLEMASGTPPYGSVVLMIRRNDEGGIERIVESSEGLTYVWTGEELDAREADPSLACDPLHGTDTDWVELRNKCGREVLDRLKQLDALMSQLCGQLDMDMQSTIC